MHFHIRLIGKRMFLFAVLFLLNACNSVSLHLGDSVKDKDWNTRFTSNCPLPRHDSIRLDVTRQMVAKTVKQLCQLGYLEQIDGVWKQKEIHFTETGEYLMSDARQLLAEMDRILFKDVDAGMPQAIVGELNTMICAVNDC